MILKWWTLKNNFIWLIKIFVKISKDFKAGTKTCIIVYDFPIFKRKLQIAITKITADLIAHKAMYYDEFNRKEVKHLRANSNHGELLFAKRDSYKDQKEFRLVYKAIVPKHRELELHLGDLSDCVSTIDLTQQAVYFSKNNFFKIWNVIEFGGKF
ncbi:hypothetical protein X281_09120 [Oenococcus oeni IOEB_0607]|uniref:hypothetical protein n=1 Tax=Oenococcus oeni TaxID=1247 RepID=UPI00050E59A8|nr:hypothetical protein [Oenococcus oeni]KGH79583.1 hypothetical protein X281_09120 [Oenococcus oeni IOEB_0607]